MLLRKLVLLTLISTSTRYCFGQQPQDATTSVIGGTETRPAAEIPAIRLEIFSRNEVSEIPEPFIATPLCGPDGNSVVVQVANGFGLGDLLNISGDGKKVVRFNRFKITDVSKPEYQSYFVADGGLYVLVKSTTQKNETVRYKTPSGEVVTQPASSVKYYIVRFQLDGTYLGAIALDIPFSPLQVGAFPGGQFLVAGRLKDGSYGPAVALVKSDGQFNRFVSLKGDIHAAKKTPADAGDKDTGLPVFGKDLDKTLFGAEASTLIVPYGRNLLLVRTGQSVPIFSISPGGEVKTVTPDVPAGFTLFDLRTARNEWTALFTRRRTDDPKDLSVLMETYALDPETGKAIARYSYPSFMGFGLACSDGFEFTVLERREKNLELFKLVPARRASSEKQPQ